MLPIVLGSLCIAYVALELGMAFRASAQPVFGAVDCSTGRTLEVTLDRRVRSRGRGAR